ERPAVALAACRARLTASCRALAWAERPAAVFPAALAVLGTLDARSATGFPLALAAPPPGTAASRRVLGVEAFTACRSPGPPVDLGHSRMIWASPLARSRMAGLCRFPAGGRSPV